MNPDLSALSVAKLVKLGGLKERCSAPLRCVAHGLNLPCELCELEERQGAVCTACGQTFPGSPPDSTHRPCASVAQFHARGVIAFADEARHALAKTAPPHETPAAKRHQEAAKRRTPTVEPTPRPDPEPIKADKGDAELRTKERDLAKSARGTWKARLVILASLIAALVGLKLIIEFLATPDGYVQISTPAPPATSLANAPAITTPAAPRPPVTPPAAQTPAANSPRSDPTVADDQRAYPSALDWEPPTIAIHLPSGSHPASPSGQGNASVSDPLIQPKLYALVSGVSDYDDNDLDLKFAAKDAKDFGAALQRQSGRLYREVVVRTLENPTSEQLLDGLDWLRQEVTSMDIAVVYLSGHGVNDPDGDYFFLTRDSNPERLRRTAVPYFEIKNCLYALPGKVLVFVDTGHSENILGEQRGVANINGLINDLTSAENGLVVFASTTGKQFPMENDQWGNGAFAKALVEGLDGAADYTQDGKITVNKLDLYLSERVKSLTGNKQTPMTIKPHTIKDFQIAVGR